MKHVAHYFRLSITLFFMMVVSCSENEEPSLKTLDGIEVPEGTLMAGKFPATSTHMDAPEIESSATDLVTIPGESVIIQTNLLSGEAIGFYLMVEGVDNHFKITSISPASNGRAKSDFPFFIIKFLESFTPREVCIQYAVYDSQGRVSNIVRRCIQIKEAGGANSGFLKDNAWQAVSFHEAHVGQGLDKEELVGVTYVKQTEVGFNCTTTGLPSNIIVEEKSRINYEYLTLSANGNAVKEKNYYFKSFDSNSNCTPAFLEATETQLDNGIWVYESTATKLYLVFTSEAAGSRTFSYDVTQSQGTITLKENLGDGHYIETLYEPKN